MSEWTYHGGRLAAAKVQFGQFVASWLDLSTGINPQPWPGAADMAIDWHRLPDARDLHALESAAAAYMGVDPDHICAVPGTEIGLRMLGGILPGSAVHADASYRTHGEIFDQSQALPVANLLAVDDATVVMANPNNPDGRILEADSLLARLHPTPHWLVIDEAFADATPELSLVKQVNDAERLIVFRSFGKFFGLAGVRLGFVIGPRPIIAQYRQKLGSWPVSAAALAIGTAAYRDESWISAARRTLEAQAGALDALLRSHGYHPVGLCPLFRLIEADDAAALFERLARQAILTRPFDYNPRWLRIGLPADEAALARLDEALRNG